jgi:hypothetical protein
MSVSYLFPPDDSLVREIDVVLPIAALDEHPAKPKRNTKAIGDISEAMLIAALVRNGFLVSIPCCSSHQHRRSGPTSSRPYFGQIEYLAVYCPTSGKVYLVPESELVATYAHLRVEPARNGQVRNIRWACEYELA